MDQFKSLRDVLRTNLFCNTNTKNFKVWRAVKTVTINVQNCNNDLIYINEVKWNEPEKNLNISEANKKIKMFLSSLLYDVTFYQSHKISSAYQAQKRPYIFEMYICYSICFQTKEWNNSFCIKMNVCRCQSNAMFNV